jgi:protein-disulfide isomerase
MLNQRVIAGFLILAGAGFASVASSSELGEIHDTQKKILEKLDAQDKVLQGIQQRLNTMQAGGGRPQLDPNKVYTIALGRSPVKGPKNAPVTLVEFSDFQ